MTELAIYINLAVINDWCVFLKQREPLAVKNQSAIPKPSRLMQPGMLAAATTRKRPAQASVDSQDKEVELITPMHNTKFSHHFIENSVRKLCTTNLRLVVV